MRRRALDTSPRRRLSALRQGRHAVLLTSTRPPLEVPRLLLLFYFFFDGLDAVVSVLDAAGVKAVISVILLTRSVRR